MPRYYKLATRLSAPLVPLWLKWRTLKGKEEPGRIAERFGKSSYARPKGTLLWIHAASVGEANSVLALIYKLRQAFPALRILLTTGTVTSAALMKQRLPEGVLHQYAPVDTPQATERFMRHWLPDVVWFVESELWPNLIDAAKRYYCFMALINARMSQRSFNFWQKYNGLSCEMLSAFHSCFAQTETDAARLRTLGARNVMATGNLKYDSPPLPCNEADLLALKKMLGHRHVWLAASTHPGEETMVAGAHRALVAAYPDLLTIIVPRHPDRGGEIEHKIGTYGKTALRSRKDILSGDTAFYIADTLGELGLFYRLSEIVFMGGSLVAHGGQNPLEPAQLGCAILTGPHTRNFQPMYDNMQSMQAVLRVQDAAELAAHVATLLAKPELRTDMQALAKTFIERQSGSSEFLLQSFAPLFRP